MVHTSAFILPPPKLLHLSAHRPLTQSTRSRIRLPPQRRCRAPPSMGLIPLIPNWIALGGWLYGAYRFYTGFSRTSYQSSFKIPLALAWPLLFAVNGSYRKNFTKSIGGADDDF